MKFKCCMVLIKLIRMASLGYDLPKMDIHIRIHHSLSLSKLSTCRHRLEVGNGLKNRS